MSEEKFVSMEKAIEAVMTKGARAFRKDWKDNPHSNCQYLFRHKQDKGEGYNLCIHYKNNPDQRFFPSKTEKNASDYIVMLPKKKVPAKKVPAKKAVKTEE